MQIEQIKILQQIFDKNPGKAGEFIVFKMSMPLQWAQVFFHRNQAAGAWRKKWMEAYFYSQPTQLQIVDLGHFAIFLA